MRSSEASVDRVPDVLIGLVPAVAGACHRCGASTRALANGRGRIDICGSCGTVDVRSPEGLELLSLRGTSVNVPVRTRVDPYRLR